MAQINDGGPAFPVQISSEATTLHGGDSMKHSHTFNAIEGLSIRDYFAAKAMQAIVSCHHESTSGPCDNDPDDHSRTTCWGYNTGLEWNETAQKYHGANEIAQSSYILADAMLAAREAK